MKRTNQRRSDHKRLRRVSEYNNLPEEADQDDDLLSQTLNQPGTSAPAAGGNLFGAGAQEHAFWTPDVINAHVAKCLELSSENKITPKNAFALQLIDYLKFLVDKKKDFSTMACSLDAGAKIYSNRVDALHEKVVGLAVEITMSARKMEGSRGEQAEASDQETSSVSRIVRKKKSIIVSDESISRRLKMEDPKDKYFKVNASPDALISGARLDPTDLCWTLENNLSFWPDYKNYKPTRAEGLAVLPKIEVFRDSLRMNNINRFDGEASGVSTVIAGTCFPSTSTPLVENDDPVAMDQDLITCDNDDCHDDPQPPSPEVLSDVENEDELNPAGETEKRNGNEVNILATAMRRLTEESEEGMRPPPTRAEAIKMLFDTKSEYHYLDMNNVKYWAGPDFWTRPHTTCKTEEKKASNRGRKKKQPRLIDYFCEDTDERWNKQFKQKPLSNKTVASWKSSKLEIPKDCKYDADTFINLFHMKLPDKPEPVRVRNVATNTQDDVNDGASGSRDGGSNPFSCSPDHADFEDDFSVGDCAGGFENYAARRGRLIKINVDSEPSLDDESMVPAPKMVTVNPLQFKARPIRVDMRHLKEKMLGLIMRDINDLATGHKTTFGKLLRELPPLLDQTTREDLTISLAFMALLTLANENELRIKGQEDGKDTVVTRWSDELYMVGDKNIAESNGIIESNDVNLLNEVPDPVQYKVECLSHPVQDCIDLASEPDQNDFERVSSPECITLE